MQDCGGSFLSKTFSGPGKSHFESKILSGHRSISECGSSIAIHECGTAMTVFLSKTFSGLGILQFSLCDNCCGPCQIMTIITVKRKILCYFENGVKLKFSDCKIEEHSFTWSKRLVVFWAGTM